MSGFYTQLLCFKDDLSYIFFILYNVEMLARGLYRSSPRIWMYSQRYISDAFWRWKHLLKAAGRPFHRSYIWQVVENFKAAYWQLIRLVDLSISERYIGIVLHLLESFYSFIETASFYAFPATLYRSFWHISNLLFSVNQTPSESKWRDLWQWIFFGKQLRMLTVFYYRRSFRSFNRTSFWWNGFTP